MNVIFFSRREGRARQFDLAHPAFLIGHNPPGATATQWAVNFNGPVRHRPLYDLRRLVLRHTYGTIASVARLASDCAMPCSASISRTA